MLGPAQFSEDYSYEQNNKGNGQPEEYLDYNLDDSQKNAEQLIESFHEQEMDENILYEMFINNDIAPILRIISATPDHIGIIGDPMA